MAKKKRKLKSLVRLFKYKVLDRLYLSMDRGHILRTRNIRLIPAEKNRRGGKYSYAEWAHVIGIFQTLMLLHLDRKEGNNILDVGCGTGLLGIASEPFIGSGGRYTGLDVMKGDIEFCRSHYPSPPYEFIHFDINNPEYAPSQKDKKIKWPIDSGGYDLVTALSVWTHLNEEDAFFYLKEVSRVLKHGGKAIISFFILDEMYERTAAKRTGDKGKYHMTPQKSWIFNNTAYGSSEWLCPKRANPPEKAIGIKDTGIDRLLSSAGLELVQSYPGNWKEVPGIYFQDVLILKKA